MLFGCAFHFEFIHNNFWFLLLFLFLVIASRGWFFILVNDLFDVENLAQSKADLLAKTFSLLESFLDCGFLRVDFLNKRVRYVQSLPFEAINGKIGILEERIYKISNGLSIED